MLVNFWPVFDRNPYQRLLVEYLAPLGVEVDGRKLWSVALRRGGVDVVHLHWLHPAFVSRHGVVAAVKFAWFVIVFMLLKLKGIRIVWTVHNLKNHENRQLWLDRLCAGFVARYCDSIIAHGNTAKETIVKTFDLQDLHKVVVIPHGHYGDFYINQHKQDAARQALNIDSSSLVYLFMGMISPYKGVVELVDAFSRLEERGVQLIVAGGIKEGGTDLIQAIGSRASDDDRVQFLPEYVPDERVQLYMNACDVVVTPYKDIFTSGSVVLAMSFGRACIAPGIGCIPEVLDDKGAFVYTPDMDSEGLLEAMRQASERRSTLDAMGRHNLERAREWGWDRVAAATLQVYQK